MQKSLEATEIHFIRRMLTVECVMDGEKDVPKSNADGVYLQETGDHKTADATK